MIDGNSLVQTNLQTCYILLTVALTFRLTVCLCQVGEVQTL